MRKTFFILFVTLFLSGTAQVPVLAQAAKKNSKRETITLFNGSNLDGWYTFLQHRGRDNDCLLYTSDAADE